MSTDPLAAGDPEHDPNPSIRTRIADVLLGSPQKAPRRIALFLVFALIGGMVTLAWLILSSRVSTDASSKPVVGPLFGIVTSPWLIPVVTIYLCRKWVLFRRSRHAKTAADISGWTVKTIAHLRDEIKTTDGCTRIIASTGQSLEEIEARIWAALDGEHDDDRVDFATPLEDDDDEEPILNARIVKEDDTDGQADEDEEVEEDGPHLFEQINSALEPVWSGLSRAVTSPFRFAYLVVYSFYALLALPFVLAKRVAFGKSEETDNEPEVEVDRRVLRTHLARGAAEADALADDLEAALADRRPDSDPNGIVTDREEQAVPWRIRFAEEVKHLWLDLQSGFRTADVLIRFGVPTAVLFGIQVLFVGLWTTLPVYALFATSSTVVGLGIYWGLKRRQQRRLRRYRQSSEHDYWYDCAGQFKTVETADVTCYMGFIAGRRYADYDKERFVRKTAKVMHEHVSDECVAPSELEHYARSLAQQKPNLRGHRENVLRPAILRELKQTVEKSEDQIIPKAELAWLVIEQPTGSRFESHIGHDPDLVSEEYRWLVEEGHVLDEREVTFRNASGEEYTTTIVYPSDKRRLPEVSERHSQFSDRFVNTEGEPIYEMADVDPTSDLAGFRPTPEAAAKFAGAEAMPAGSQS